MAEGRHLPEVARGVLAAGEGYEGATRGGYPVAERGILLGEPQGTLQNSGQWARRCTATTITSRCNRMDGPRGGARFLHMNDAGTKIRSTGIGPHRLVAGCSRRWKAVGSEQDSREGSNHGRLFSSSLAEPFSARAMGRKRASRAAVG